MRGKFGIIYQMRIRNLTKKKKRVRFFQTSGAGSAVVNGSYYEFQTDYTPFYLSGDYFRVKDINGFDKNTTLTSSLDRSGFEDFLNANFSEFGTWVLAPDATHNTVYLYTITEPVEFEITRLPTLTTENELFYITTESNNPLY